MVCAFIVTAAAGARAGVARAPALPLLSRQEQRPEDAREYGVGRRREDEGGGGAGWRCAAHQQRASARSVGEGGMNGGVSTFMVARCTRTH
jgi:hypothetical protein